MADGDGDPHKEGWRVPFRTGALWGVAIPILLGLATLAGGAVYDHTLRAKLRYAITPQPAPGLETAIHPAGRDPETAAFREPVDPAIERAKAEVAKSGLVGWEVAR